MQFVARHPFLLAVLVVIASFVTAGGLRSIEADVSIACRLNVEPVDCTESYRSAWIDNAAILVVLGGIAGAAAIIFVNRRRRTRSWKSHVRVYAVCLAITVGLYAALVFAVLVFA